MGFFEQNAGPEQVEWKLQLERKLFAAKFDEAKMQGRVLRTLVAGIGGRGIRVDVVDTDQ